MKNWFYFFCTFFCIGTYAQETVQKNNQSDPIPVEVLFGNTRLALQTTIAKQFSGNSKWGFLLVASLTSDYDISKKTTTGIMVPVAVTYKIFNTVALNGGLAFNPIFGKRALLGLTYAKHYKDFMIFVIPTMYFSDSQFFETLVSVEYKPKLNSKLNWYTQLKGLYNFDIQNKDHDRSYFYARLGLEYKNTTFGIGYNWDSYGPLQINVNNAGVFIKTVLF